MTEHAGFVPPGPPRVVEISRNDALALGIAAEGYRKMGLTPPDWMQQGADLVDGTSDGVTPIEPTLWQAFRNRVTHSGWSNDPTGHNGHIGHTGNQVSNAADQNQGTQH